MVELKYIIFFIFVITINLLFVINYNLIGKIYRLHDIPNESRKLHDYPVPLIGGLIILINLGFFLIFEFFIINKVYLSDTYYLDNYFLSSKKAIASFTFTLFSLFALGYLDDKYNLDPFKKLLVLFIIFYIFFSLDSSLVLSSLNLSFISYSIPINEIGFFLSIFLSLLFLNAINMYDGINGQVGLSSLNIFIYFLCINFMPMFAILIIISLSFFLFLNLKGNIFLGDSGCYVISFILIYFFLRYYQEGLIRLDEIFIFFFLPITDAIRLFAVRILYSGQPWKADANHLHHLLIKKFSYKIALISQYLFSITMILLLIFTDVSTIHLIIFSTFSYFVGLIILKKNKFF